MSTTLENKCGEIDLSEIGMDIGEEKRIRGGQEIEHMGKEYIRCEGFGRGVCNTLIPKPEAKKPSAYGKNYCQTCYERHFDTED